MAIINNIEELADDLMTTVRNLKSEVNYYTDYQTLINWDDRSVSLTTVVPEAGVTLTKTLHFPFTDTDYDDALTGLQCWADDQWCKAQHKEV